MKAAREGMRPASKVSRALRELEAGIVLWIEKDAVHWIESDEVIAVRGVGSVRADGGEEKDRRGRRGAGVGEGAAGDTWVGWRRKG